jgi:hypothetical protein
VGQNLGFVRHHDASSGTRLREVVKKRLTKLWPEAERFWWSVEEAVAVDRFWNGGVVFVSRFCSWNLNRA